jgi:hypothetical protein
MAVGCGATAPEPEDASACAPPPIDRRQSEESVACERERGAMTEYSSTCGDGCDATSLCGQAFTTQCDCGPGRCFSGWECVPDACAKLYTFDALEALRERPVSEALERIQQRLAALDALPIERELAAVIELRRWLVATFGDVHFQVDASGGPLLAPEASTTPRMIVIEVWLYGSTEYLRYMPRSRDSFLELSSGTR